jgi:excisionase family DNA binding protein
MDISASPVSPSTRSKRARLESATYSLSDFAALLGISYTAAHEAARAGTLPVSPIRQGRLYLFPKAAVHRLLEMEPDTPTADVSSVA